MKPKLIKVHIPQRGTHDFPLDTSLVSKLAPWEMEWLAQNMSHGLVPHGYRNGAWVRSPLSLSDLNLVADELRTRIRRCNEEKSSHERAREAMSKWLGFAFPDLVHLFSAGTMTEKDAIELLRDEIFPVPGENGPAPFSPLCESDVAPCCDQRAIKYSSERHPTGMVGMERDIADFKDYVELPDVLRQLDPDKADVTFWVRLHQAWCSACDPERSRRVIRLGFVAQVTLGPYVVQQEYELKGSSDDQEHC